MKGVLIREVAEKMGIFSDCDACISEFRIDSRLVSSGDLFFALPGERTDGHAFLPDVCAQGAVAAVVRRGISFPGLHCLEVDDVFLALRNLAQLEYALKSAPIIGVTGSVGKTMTKDFIATLLQGSLKVGKSPKSYNSQQTFPLTLLNCSGDEEVLVLEMAMSKRGDLSRLAEIAAPKIAVVTKIALAHAMHFPEGLSSIAEHKMELCKHPNVQIALLDHEILDYPSALNGLRAERLTFSTKNSLADYYLSSFEGKIRIDERGVRAWEGEAPFLEDHLLHNVLVAIASVRQMGVKWETIEARLKNLVLPSMRFERIEKGGVLFINDAYNANPASMRAALEHLPQPKEGSKAIAVLGSMKELGTHSQKAHFEVGLLAQKRIDHLLCLGEETEALLSAFSEAKKPAERLTTREEIASRLQELMRPGDVVLLKGSRSLQLESVLELL